MKVELLSHDQVYESSFKLAGEVIQSGYKPQWVIAIARGGFPVARNICDFLDIKNLASLQLSHYAEASAKKDDVEVRNEFTADISGKRILLVDDVNDSGETLLAAMDLLEKHNPGELRSAVLHHKVNSSIEVNYFSERIKAWRWVTYPWAAMEDLAKFIRDLQLEKQSNHRIRKRLKKEHDMEVSDELLEKLRQSRGSPFDEG